MKLPNSRNAKKATTSTKKYKKAALITGVSIVALGTVSYTGAMYDQSSLEQSNTPIVIEVTRGEISMDYHTHRQTINANLAGISSFAEVTIGEKNIPIKQRKGHTGTVEHIIDSISEGDSQVIIAVVDGKRQAKKTVTLKRQTKADYDKQELERRLARIEEALQKAESNMNDETIAGARAEIQRLPEEKRTHFNEREKRQQEQKERAEQEKRAAEAEKKRQEEQQKREEEAAALRAQQRASRQYTPQPQRQYSAQPRHAAPNPAPQPPATSGPRFKSCKEARAAGYSHMRRGQPGYAPHLDGDDDGIACDKHR